MSSRQFGAEPQVRSCEDPSKVEAVIRDDPEALAAFREAMKHQGERTDLGNNVPEVDRQPRGNSRAFSIARVQRECDAETVAAVMAGEMSANALRIGFGTVQDLGKRVRQRGVVTWTKSKPWSIRLRECAEVRR